MIVIIAGTDRANSNTFKVTQMADKFLTEKKISTHLIDLAKLPEGLLSPKHYGNPPDSFKDYQDVILKCSGIITVIPEYNGSFPGAFKYFIDLLKFPESLRGKPCAFIGLAAGSFGGVRAVEQMEMVFQYREANIFGLRSFFVHVEKKIDTDKLLITDELTKTNFERMLNGFEKFVNSQVKG